MKKVGIVFWSGTGNTEVMANKIAEGVNTNGGESSIFSPSDFNSTLVNNFDVIAFGCPSMGAEQLEDGEFEPMFNDVKSALDGKNIALFGSFGWGDCEWMRDWEDSCKSVNANLLCDSLTINETPDASGEQQCIEFGATLAK